MGQGKSRFMEIFVAILCIGMVGGGILNMSGCTDSTPKATSGVQKATVKVQTGSDGLTTEQRNIKERLLADNKPGAVKHLYVISAYSGQVIIYSTVIGKVTSSSKRITPNTVTAQYTETMSNQPHNGIPVSVGGRSLRTTEVLQDDGTYGSSVPYLYWFDANKIFHKHYVSGGQILHVSSAPISVKSVIINMEMTDDDR